MSDYATLWTVTHQDPLFMGLSRQEYWSGSGLHARGEGERVLALESREGTRASRRVEEGLSRSLSQPLDKRLPVA